MTPKTLTTAAEIDALFGGTLQPKAAPRLISLPAKSSTARYDRCSACRTMMPCLLSFSGETDWSPALALDAPVRAAITELRRTTNKRTILLCSPCLDDLSQYRPPEVVAVVSDRLFDL